MVKVKNGWESNTLEEIESLASQHGSPKPSLTTTSSRSKQQPPRSPRAIQNPSLRLEGITSVSSGGTVAPDGGRSLNHRRPAVRVHPQRLMNGSERRALAPPADIVPGSRRRQHHANPPPNGYRSLDSQRATGSKQRTASQNAAMEADAVETLLFLASPGNSGHGPSSSGAMTFSPWMSTATSLQASPLKSDFSGQELPPTPQKRVTFTGLPNPIPRAADIRSEIDIDRMIDDMDDASSDSGLDYTDKPPSQQPGADHAVPT